MEKIPQNQNNVENLEINEAKEEEVSLEKETGITLSLIEKIKSNPGLRKAFISLILAAGLTGAAESANAQQNEGKDNGHTIEASKSNFENLVKDVDKKELKNILSGFEAPAGSIPLDDVFERYTSFKVTSPVLGAIEFAAEHQAQQALITSGVLHDIVKNKIILTFSKKTDHGYLVIKVLAYKI